MSAGSSDIEVGTAAHGPTRRPRNPRGQGRRLREEILRAAADLLDETGSDSAVTLRAVARRAGIAAPSIYAHFADREAILLAVVQDAFTALEAHLRAASGTGADPVERLRAVCAAYLDFALHWPQRYRVMFGGLWDAVRAQNAAGRPVRPTAAHEPLLVGDRAFTVLVRVLTDCIDTGRSRSADPFADAAALWVALHGLAQLRTTAPLFPWPPELLDVLVDRLALLGGSDPDPAARAGGSTSEVVG